MHECPGAADGGIHQENATSAEARSDIAVLVETIRPSVLLLDRDSRYIETRGNREIFALEKLAMLVAKTDVALVDNWRSEYLPLAFPFSIPAWWDVPITRGKNVFADMRTQQCLLRGKLRECALGEWNRISRRIGI